VSHIWIRVQIKSPVKSKFVASEFFFRKADMKGITLTKQMKYAKFASGLRESLDAVGRDPGLYCVHSLRRGGAQEYNKKWGFVILASWAGWSLDEGTSMFKYLMGLNDGAPCARDEYMRPGFAFGITTQVMRATN
jgi:hypothetical protein